jgi:dephospho-CoA kinase
MQKVPKQEKFDFEKMKARATSQNAAIRKRTFKEYFERFQEFPSYLFDNSEKIDDLLYQTIQDLLQDAETTKAMHKGIEILMMRLPSPSTQS